MDFDKLRPKPSAASRAKARWGRRQVNVLYPLPLYLRLAQAAERFEVSLPQFVAFVVEQALDELEATFSEPIPEQMEMEGKEPMSAAEWVEQEGL